MKNIFIYIIMKNIGLTIRTIDNFNEQIYSSGIDQNIMILYNYLKIHSYVRFFHVMINQNLTYMNAIIFLSYKN